MGAKHGLHAIVSLKQLKRLDDLGLGSMMIAKSIKWITTEIITLRARLDRAEAENEAWRSGAMYLIHVETDEGFVDKFAHKDRGYWEPFDTIDEAVDALLAEEDGKDGQ